MKIYCKNKFLNMYSGLELPLTFGKCYEIVRKGKEKYQIVIVNDSGKESAYSLFRFFSQDEWRDHQLNNILELE